MNHKFLILPILFLTSSLTAVSQTSGVRVLNLDEVKSMIAYPPSGQDASPHDLVAEVEIKIDAEGNYVDQISSISNDSALQTALFAQLSQLTCSPAMEEGAPVSSTILITCSWWGEEGTKDEAGLTLAMNPEGKIRSYVLEAGEYEIEEEIYLLEASTGGYEPGDPDGAQVSDMFADEPTDIAPSAVPEIHDFIVVDQEPVATNYEEIRERIGYPQIAQDAGIEGKVVARTLVDESGNYVRHKIVSSVHPILNTAVEREIENLTFSPALQGDRPINFWVNITFEFEVEE